jgi:branched-chain amino acid transport system substrate-binding protein
VLNGGQVLDKLRTPLRSPDFTLVLQRARDAKPDALCVFLPSGQGAQFMKQFAERCQDKAGIRPIATGDVTDDDPLADMGDVALGVVNAHHYSAAHPSAMKGQTFESPRGNILIDAQTCDTVQDSYIRKVEKKDDQLWNI